MFENFNIFFNNFKMEKKNTIQVLLYREKEKCFEKSICVMNKKTKEQARSILE